MAIFIQENFADTEVWNPWQENPAKMKDMGENDYLRMICLEPAQVSKPIVLKPGQTFKAKHVISVAKITC